MAVVGLVLRDDYKVWVWEISYGVKTGWYDMSCVCEPSIPDGGRAG